MLQVNRTDVARAHELMKLLSRAKLELEGAEEMLAAGQVLSWFGEHTKKIKTDWEQQETQAQQEIKDALAFKQAAQTAKPLAQTPAKVENAVVTPKKKGK
jgi:hypothetical protein